MHFLDCKIFVVPSFKITASIFPEISFVKYFPLFSCKQYAYEVKNMGTISVPSRTLCPTVEVANGDFFVF